MNKVNAKKKEAWCGPATNFILVPHCWLQWTQPWLIVLVSWIMGKSLEDKLILQGCEFIDYGLSWEEIHNISSCWAVQWQQKLWTVMHTDSVPCFSVWLTASLWNLCKAPEITWTYLKTMKSWHTLIFISCENCLTALFQGFIF